MNGSTDNNSRNPFLTLGISGHRKAADLNDSPGLRSKLREELRCILDPPSGANLKIPVQIYSPLADGADRLLVEVAWKIDPTVRLVPVLPFARPAYEATFESSASVGRFRDYLARTNCAEIIEVPGGRSGDFVPLGKFIVDHADVMFFLHNGNPILSGPLDGGTGSILRYALNDPRLKEMKLPELIPEIPPYEELNPRSRARPLRRICYLDTGKLESVWIQIP